MSAIPVRPIPQTKDERERQAFDRSVRRYLGEGGIVPWVRVDKAGALLTDIPTRPHSALQSIGQVDVTSSDTAKDKHVSNALAKGWEDHKSATGNPHGATTSDIAEGTRLFFTDERVDDRVNALITIPAGDALTKTYDDAANSLELSVTKASAVTDSSTTVSGTADLTYDATERDMINALKTDVEALSSKLNTLLANLRSANLLST